MSSTLALKPGMTPQDLADATQWSSSGWPPLRCTDPSLRRASTQPAQPSPPSQPKAAHEPSATLQHMRQKRQIDRAFAGSRAPSCADIRTSHCDQANAAMVTMMVAAQVFKDHFMARGIWPGSAPAGKAS